MSRFVRLALCTLLVLAFAAPAFPYACGACQSGVCNYDVITNRGCRQFTSSCTTTPPPCALAKPEDASLSNDFAVASVEVKRHNQPTVVEHSNPPAPAAAR